MNNKATQLNKKALLFGAMGAIIILAVVAYALVSKKPVAFNNFSCNDSQYRSIKNGMSKAEITTLLGAPARKRIKDSTDQNFFAQGENEAKIKEGWVYDDARDYKSAEIYFDSAGRVSGKGCGQG